MKFIELTYLETFTKFIQPLTVDLFFEQGNNRTIMIACGERIPVRESLEEIQQKICRLGGDVQ